MDTTRQRTQLMLQETKTLREHNYQQEAFLKRKVFRSSCRRRHSNTGTPEHFRSERGLCVWQLQIINHSKHKSENCKCGESLVQFDLLFDVLTFLNVLYLNKRVYNSTTTYPWCQLRLIGAVLANIRTGLNLFSVSNCTPANWSNARL
jgi:hypothetical protein